MRPFFFLVVMLAYIHLLHAQDLHNGKAFGLLAGVNYSNMNFNMISPRPASPIPNSFKPSVRLGAFLNVALLNNLSLQTEYLYSRLNGERKPDNTSYHLNYLIIPVLLKYQFIHKLFILAGPEVGVLINAKKNENGTSTVITHDTEERSVGLTGGVSYTISKNIGLDFRYFQGLNHIGIGQRSDLMEFKIQQCQLMIGYSF